MHNLLKRLHLVNLSLITEDHEYHIGLSNEEKYQDNSLTQNFKIFLQFYRFFENYEQLFVKGASIQKLGVTIQKSC